MDLGILSLVLAVLGILVVALLYSNLGNGGASGYAAVMILFGMVPVWYRPSVLLLTLLVAIVATIGSYRSGSFRWHAFWPFAAGSIPTAFLAANMKVRPVVYLSLLAIVLLCAATRLFFGIGILNERKPKVVPVWIAVPAGGVIGLVAGFAGIGGGIFLSPLLVLMNWATTEEAVATVAPFVLLNTAVVYLLSQPDRPLLVAHMIYFAPAALIGAWIGTELDMRSAFPFAELNKAVAILLVGAALKVISTII